MNLRVPAFSSFTKHQGSYRNLVTDGTVNLKTGEHRYQHAYKYVRDPEDTSKILREEQYTLLWTDGTKVERAHSEGFDRTDAINTVAGGINTDLTK